MGFFKRAKNKPESEDFASPLLSISDPAVAEYFGLSTIMPTATESSVLALSAVYRAVSLISGTIASLPLKTYRTAPDGSRVRLGSFLDTPAGPDSDVTPYEWTETLVVSLLLHGNYFALKLKNNAGALIGLDYIHPSMVSVKKENGRKLFTIAGEDYTSEVIFHVPALATDGCKGKGILQLARESMAVSMAADRQAYTAFSKGALIQGLVTPASENEELSPEDARAIKEALNRTVLGQDNANDIAVINRFLKWTPWQHSAKEAQFLESRTFQVDEIARWFGLPPHLLGLTEKQTSWGTGVAEQNHGLARFTLQPWTKRIEQRLSRLLPNPRFTEFDYAGLLQPTPAVEIKLILEQVNGGLITLNEGRRLRNLEPVAGGDVFRLPAGSTSTEAPPVDEDGPDAEAA